MLYRDNGNRFKYYYKWELTKQTPYNYETDGLIQHILSKNIVSTKNKILKAVLLYYEQSIIFLLKYVDRLKHFKNYHWKNR